MGIIFAAFACSKDEANFSEELVRKTTDPVIEKYSDMGTVNKMDDTYVGQSDGLCSNHIAIYQYTPDSGPYAGQICEVYRFAKLSDISGPCDATFDKKEVKIESGAISYTSCPQPGKNCKELDSDWGCTLVFCDEGEVK